MRQSKAIENILEILKEGAIPFSDMYNDHFKKNLRKSEFAACIETLKNDGWIIYKGNFDDPSDIVLSTLGERQLEQYGSYGAYFKDTKQVSRYDKFITWTKNNRFAVAIYVITGIAITVLSLANPFKDLWAPSKTAENTSDTSLKNTDTIKNSPVSIPKDRDTVVISKIDTVVLIKPNPTPSGTISVRPVTLPVSTGTVYRDQLCKDLQLILNDTTTGFKALKFENGKTNYKIDSCGAISRTSDKKTISTQYFKGAYVTAKEKRKRLTRKLSEIGVAVKDSQKPLWTIALKKKTIKVLLEESGNKGIVTLTVTNK